MEIYFLKQGKITTDIILLQQKMLSTAQIMFLFYNQAFILSRTKSVHRLLLKC